jgi:excisionase family DNA binding protein
VTNAPRRIKTAVLPKKLFDGIGGSAGGRFFLVAWGCLGPSKKHRSLFPARVRCQNRAMPPEVKNIDPTAAIYQAASYIALAEGLDAGAVVRIAAILNERLGAMLPGQMLTVPDAAKRLGVSTATVLRHIRAGRLPASLISTGERDCYRISPADLDIFRRTGRAPLTPAASPAPAFEVARVIRPRKSPTRPIPQ